MSEAPAESSQPFDLTVTGDNPNDRNPDPTADPAGPTAHGHSDGLGADAGEAHRRAPLRRIILLALLVIAMAALGTLGYLGWQISTQKNAVLTTPDTIGELHLDKTDDGQQTAQYLQTALAAEVNLKQTVGAVYQDAARRSILFFGGTATIWSPESQLDSAFGLISDKQGAVTGLHAVDTGKLGGTMKCGTTKSDNGDLTVCGWADHGSLALAMFPSQPESAAAPLLREIRDATQERH